MGDDQHAALSYWRAACALAVSHLFGLTWPPPGRPQRSRLVGHWGCNPGIAWITGHLAAAWAEPGPFHLVVGTGHASSFLFAHSAIQQRLPAAAISVATRRYGSPGGDASELLGFPGLPYFGGELGPALGVSQGMAAHAGGRPVVCVVGDGECETPAALAALAHADVILPPGSGPWLPVINANGARMGGPSRYRERDLTRLLYGLGYQAVCSGSQPTEAAQAAAQAWRECLAGQRVAWISVTDKGWPAPEVIGGRRYRGHAAHKIPAALRGGGQAPAGWFDVLGVAELLAGDGSVREDVAALALRADLSLPAEPAPARRPGIAGPASQPDQAADGPVPWQRPVAAADATLARHGVAVYSPDEAASNRLAACLAAGLVTEVLAEEVCAAWTWGAVEAGQAAAFASYEAFAPLAGSLLAQYAKLTHARPPRNTPPLLVLSTSLGWANAPTHQNTDLAGMLLARPQPRVEVVYPVGAASAAKRLAWLVTGLTDGAALVTCSKQPLLDPPDPGGSAVRYELAGAPPPTGCLIAIGDVCVTEAIAATVIAAGLDVALAVIAVIDLKHAVPALAGMASWLAGRPVAAAAWCAPAYAKPLLWEGAGRIIPLRGYEERWAPTAWETLRRNGLDRISLLHALAGEGVDLPAGGLRAAAAAQDVDGTSSLETVPRFDCPALWASPVHGQPGELTFGERAEAGGHL